MDAYLIAKGITKAAIDTVTDPKKAWAYIKSEIGVDNYAKSIDPNLPVTQRINQSLIGTFKLGSTIFSAVKGLAGLKNGVGKLSGMVDDVIGAGAPKLSGGAVPSGLKGAAGTRRPADAGNHGGREIDGCEQQAGYVCRQVGRRESARLRRAWPCLRHRLRLLGAQENASARPSKKRTPNFWQTRNLCGRRALPPSRICTPTSAPAAAQRR